MGIVERFPYGKDSYFVTQSPNPNLNRAQRGEGMESSRLGGAINERWKAETGYRNTSGGGHITGLFVSLLIKSGSGAALIRFCIFPLFIAMSEDHFGEVGRPGSLVCA